MARPDENGMITCTGCGRALPGDVEHFHQHRDAFKPKCKECRGGSFGVDDPNKVYDTPEGMKICTGCRQTLPADVEHFHRSQKTDGFVTTCKECRGGTYGVDRPNRVYDVPEGHKYCIKCRRLLPHDDEHFIKTHNECKECRGIGFGIHRPNRVKDVPEGYKYCSKCHELLPKSPQNFHHAGDRLTQQCQECHNETCRQWAQENREKVRAMQRAYERTDRGKAKRAQQKARRRDRISAGEHTLTASQWNACRTHWTDEDGEVHCAYCGTPAARIERDHVIPVAEGGGTTAGNVVPACRGCNASKSTYPLSEWYPEQDFYTEDRATKINKWLAVD